MTAACLQTQTLPDTHAHTRTHAHTHAPSTPRAQDLLYRQYSEERERWEEERVELTKKAEDADLARTDAQQWRKQLDEALATVAAVKQGEERKLLASLTRRIAKLQVNNANLERRYKCVHMLTRHNKAAVNTHACAHAHKCKHVNARARANYKSSQTRIHTHTPHTHNKHTRIQNTRPPKAFAGAPGGG